MKIMRAMSAKSVPNNSMPPPDICPVCGAEVSPAMHACPECGADDKTGWNEDRAVYDGLDLPDDEFHYDAYVQSEFGNACQASKPGKRAWLWILGILLGLLALSLVLLM